MTIIASSLIVSAAVVVLVSQRLWLAVLLILIWSIAGRLIAVGRTPPKHQRVQEHRLHDVWTAVYERVAALSYGLSYQHRYFQYLRNAPRFQLTRHLITQSPVVVELRIADQPAHSTSDLIAQGVPTSLHMEPHPIWDYFACAQLSQVHIVIVGAPGSGKTTLLKYIARAMILGGNNHKPVSIPRKIPILLFLRDHAATINQLPLLTLQEVIEEALKRPEGCPAPPGWFGRRLEQGGCLIMLDGIDEVADPVIRGQVVAWVQNQIQKYHRNRFIVTSRPVGYRANPLPDMLELVVQSFRGEQIEQFVQGWYLNKIASVQGNVRKSRAEARRKADDLLTRLRSSARLFRLADNPLRLTILADVHESTTTLPDRRVDLYDAICKLLLQKVEHQATLAFNVTLAQRREIVQVLAYHMMSHETREISLNDALLVIEEPLGRFEPGISGEAFIKHVLEKSDLLLESENEVYSFTHLTYQEYLAAQYIIERDRMQELIERVGLTWWRETILMCAAMTDATPVITVCLSSERPSPEKLTLAIESLEDEYYIQPELREQIERFLIRGVEDSDAEVRKLIAEALLTLRISHMTPMTERAYLDRSAISHSEYQLFLDERRARDVYYHPDHWTEDRFPAGHGRLPVVGIRYTDAEAFCHWLTQRDKSGWRYRLATRDEPEAGEQVSDAYESLIVVFRCWIGDQNDAHEVSGIGGVPPLRETALIERLAADLERAGKHNYGFHNISHRDADIVDAISHASQHVQVLLTTHRRQFEVHLASARAQELPLDLDRTADHARFIRRVFQYDHKYFTAEANDSMQARGQAYDQARQRLQTIEQALGNAGDYFTNVVATLKTAKNLADNLIRHLQECIEQDRIQISELIGQSEATAKQIRNLENDVTHERALADDAAIAFDSIHRLRRELTEAREQYKTDVISYARGAYLILQEARQRTLEQDHATDFVEVRGRNRHLTGVLMNAVEHMRTVIEQLTANPKRVGMGKNALNSVETQVNGLLRDQQIEHRRALSTVAASEAALRDSRQREKQLMATIERKHHTEQLHTEAHSQAQMLEIVIGNSINLVSSSVDTIEGLQRQIYAINRDTFFEHQNNAQIEQRLSRLCQTADLLAGNLRTAEQQGRELTRACADISESAQTFRKARRAAKYSNNEIDRIGEKVSKIIKDGLRDLRSAGEASSRLQNDFLRAKGHALDVLYYENRIRKIDKILDDAGVFVDGLNQVQTTRQPTKKQSQPSWFCRWYIRLFALEFALEYMTELEERLSSSRSLLASLFGDSAEQENIQRVIETCLRVYIDMLILEERITGAMPAFESIRIVKERSNGLS